MLPIRRSRSESFFFSRSSAVRRPLMGGLWRVWARVQPGRAAFGGLRERCWLGWRCGGALHRQGGGHVSPSGELCSNLGLL
jgi:hypothetical protein